MAGFLDPKTRVMDVILTELGRLQMTKGEFNIQFVSFSDAGVEYVDSGDGVLEPITERLFFEPYSSSNDEIIPEIDNVGKFTIDQPISATLAVRNGVLYEKNQDMFIEVDGYSKVTSFVNASKDKFEKLGILNTISTVTEFETDVNSFSLPYPEDNSPVNQSTTDLDAEIKLLMDQLPPINVDPRFEFQINMRYLPPVSKLNGSMVPIRSFNKWTTTNTDADILETSRLRKLLENIDQYKTQTRGNSNDRKYGYKRIDLGDDNDESYKLYNLLGQVFVKKLDTIKKYTIIDAGEFFNADNVAVCKIYFLGFVYKDPMGTTKFSNEFTVMFHNGEIE